MMISVARHLESTPFACFLSLTNFVPHIKICKSSGRGFAEQDDPPLSSLGEFHTLIMNLMCKFSSWS